MAMRTLISRFLTANEAIDKLNFRLRQPATREYSVWPDGYKTQIARAINKRTILIARYDNLPSDVSARYSHNYNVLMLRSNFNIRNWWHQALVVHECTHALMDYCNFGPYSTREADAVAYIAEAVFLKALGKSPPSSLEVREKCKPIADVILAGAYYVPENLAADLMRTIASETRIQNETINSDGLRRTWTARTYEEF